MKNRPHRRQRKRFPGPHFPGTTGMVTQPSTLDGYKRFALKTQAQFEYLGIEPGPKFGEL